MEQAYKEIAPRLVGLRDALGLTVAEMAQRIGVSGEELERYESGTVEIPVGFLLRVSQSCGVELNTLIAGSEAHLTNYSLVRAGRGLSVERRKDYDYKSLAYCFKGRRMEPFEICVPPKRVEDMNFIQHMGQEFIYMLEGRLELRIAEAVVELNPGDSIYFDSHNPHAMRSLGETQARFLDVIL